MQLDLEQTSLVLSVIALALTIAGMFFSLVFFWMSLNQEKKVNKMLFRIKKTVKDIEKLQYETLSKVLDYYHKLSMSSNGVEEDSFISSLDDIKEDTMSEVEKVVEDKKLGVQIGKIIDQKMMANVRTSYREIADHRLSELQKKILFYVLQTDGISLEKLSKKAEMGSNAVIRSANRLIKKGLIEKSEQGSEVCYSPKTN